MAGRHAGLLIARSPQTPVAQVAHDTRHENEVLSITISGGGMKFVGKLHNDVLGGALMFAVGFSVAVHSTSLKIGTLSDMGPGYFPLILGVILTFVGIAITVKGYLSILPRKEQKPPEWKAWLLICLGMISFVVLSEYLGLVAATFAIVFISALADRKNSWRSAAVLALAMVPVSVIVFWWILQIQLPLFKWGGA
jgi:hypothetical protein